MTLASRRLVLFVAAFVVGLGLLAALLLLFAQPPRPVTPTLPPATAAPKIVATVDDEPIYIDNWQQAVALDQAMSGLVGQVPPSPEETLDRLINERLVLREAEKAGLQVDPVRAEAWLASFLTSWNLEEALLEQTLTRFGLTRAELVGEIVPRLLRVEQALQELPGDGNGEAWVADLRSQAKVALLEYLSTPLTPNVSTPVPLTSPAVGLRVGELAPDFSLETLDGKTVNLSDLGGQPVLLNFWAVWCTPCLEELSMLQELLLRGADNDDLVILAIAVREPHEKVITFASDQGLGFPLLLDPDGQVSDAYQVHGFPTSLFVDRDGLIVARHVGPLDRETLIGYLSTLSVDFPLPTAVP